MSANANWARWIFASLASRLKDVAISADLPVVVEHLDERTDAYMRSPDRAEIRITGPFSQELSQGYHRIWVDANVLLTSRLDGASKNGYSILKNAGLFHEAMSEPIPVWNYGNEPGDFDANDPATQISLGCLSLRPGPNESIRVFNFGQTEKVDRIRQSVVDARYVIYLTE